VTHEQREAGLVTVAALAVAFAVWWLVGFPGLAW
jgi:hypothetical protein